MGKITRRGWPKSEKVNAREIKSLRWGESGELPEESLGGREISTRPVGERYGQEAKRLTPVCRPLVRARRSNLDFAYWVGL